MRTISSMQKVFALPYLLTTPDGTLLSFLFGEEGGGGEELVFLFSEDRDTLIEQSYILLLLYNCKTSHNEYKCNIQIKICSYS